MRTLFYMTLAWLFILAEYVQRATAFVRAMNAKPVGRHAGGRHRLEAVPTPYVPRRVDGAVSHRRRQGMLLLDDTRSMQQQAA